MFLDKLTSIFGYPVSSERRLALARRETEKIRIAEEELERQRIFTLRNRYAGVERPAPSAQGFSVEEVIDLGVARTNKEIWNRPGKGFYVTAFHADQDNTRIRFNNPASPYYRLHRGYIKTNFNKIYLTNTAQAGKELRFIISFDNSAEFRLGSGADIQNAYDELVTIRGLIDFLKLNSLRPAPNPTVLNANMATLNTEYSLVLPEATRELQFTLADGTAFRYAWETGKVATPTAPYFSVPANTVIRFHNLALYSKTLYFACGVNTKVMQVSAVSD